MMTRKDYIETAKILNYASDKTHPALFGKMVSDFVSMFKNDNPRFDEIRFRNAVKGNQRHAAPGLDKSSWMWAAPFSIVCQALQCIKNLSRIFPKCQTHNV